MWSVVVEGDLRDELLTMINIYKSSQKLGGEQILEQVVDIVRNVRIEIYVKEHPPPHFHIRLQGQSASFDICTGKLLRGDARRVPYQAIRNWHKNNREKLIETWNNLRPSDCPVGKVEC